MPWDAGSFRKHNRFLSLGQADRAARIANAVLEETGDEGLAVRTANEKVMGKKRKRPVYRSTGKPV